MAKRRYTIAQKEAVERYLEKNELVPMVIKVSKKKKEEYQRRAAAEGKSLTRYVVDKLDA